MTSEIPADQPATNDARNRTRIGCGIVVLLVLVLLIILGSRAIDRLNWVMIHGPGPTFTSDELRDRPDITEVLPTYERAAAAARDTISSATATSWRVNSEPSYPPRDPGDLSVFTADLIEAYGEPQYVDGHPSMSWTPPTWEGTVDATVNWSFSATLVTPMEQALEPLGFTVEAYVPSEEQAKASMDPTQLLPLLFATDRYGAQFNIRGGGDTVAISFSSGVHLYADAGSTCEVETCHPTLTTPLAQFK